MRVLEVRFRPQIDEPLLIVGHLVWYGGVDGEPALLRPAASLEGTDSSAVFMAKLEYLVSSTAPDCFERLQQLRSRFWSFVEVPPAVLKTEASGTQPTLVKSWFGTHE